MLDGAALGSGDIFGFCFRSDLLNLIFFLCCVRHGHVYCSELFLIVVLWFFFTGVVFDFFLCYFFFDSEFCGQIFFYFWYVLFFTLLVFVKYLGNYYILQPWLVCFFYGYPIAFEHNFSIANQLHLNIISGYSAFSIATQLHLNMVAIAFEQGWGIREGNPLPAPGGVPYHALQTISLKPSVFRRWFGFAWLIVWCAALI